MRAPLRLTTLTVLFAPSVLLGQTILQCPLLENETLRLADSPYRLTCNLELENVTIESGVRIEATGRLQIKVLGGLRAVGTPSRQIVFTTTGASTKWQGPHFNSSTSQSEPAYCVVENSINSGIRINEASPTIRHCVIARNQAVYGAGIKISGSQPVILEDCTISEHTYAGHDPRGGGICTASHLTLIRCEVLDNSISDIHGGCSGDASALGGGVCSETDVVREKVVVMGNTARSKGGGANSRGGGVYASGNRLARNSTIVNDNACAGGCNWDGLCHS